MRRDYRLLATLADWLILLAVAVGLVWVIFILATEKPNKQPPALSPLDLLQQEVQQLRSRVEALERRSQP
jgi:hypothetical protein